MFHGEILEIWEQNGRLMFLVNNGYIYKVENDSVKVKSRVANKLQKIGLTDVVNTSDLKESNEVMLLSDTVQVEPLGDHMQAILKKNNGLIIADEHGRELYAITEANGLCSDNVSYIAYNGHGRLWGVTTNGIFSVALPSAYSRFTAKEGISGTVLCMTEFGGKMYVGTGEGLFCLKGRSFEQVGNIRYGCWKLAVTRSGLLAATANGIYRVSPDGSVRQLSTTSSTAVMNDGDKFYSGEMNGVYVTQESDNSRRKISAQAYVTNIVKDAQGTLWLQNLYGEIWYAKKGDEGFRRWQEASSNRSATIVKVDGRVEIVPYDATTPFPYPLTSYQNDLGVTWLTDGDGKSLYRGKDGKRLNDINWLLTPLSNMSVRALYQKNNALWIGTDNGLTVLDIAYRDSALLGKPRLLIRSVVLNGDSVLWGGYGKMPEHLADLSSDERNLRFTYALEHTPLVGKTLYRYKVNDGDWSAWEDDNEAEFLNLSHGSYTITIQARLASGKLSEETSCSFDIAYPIYLRWYMNLLYVLVSLLVAYALFRHRVRRLEREKNQLESIVQERTAEVVRQKDEIQEKSDSLERALDELHGAQRELIRQEKMATVGKLTQGLIDRILNPLNYINNFSKLSEGLVKDVEDNIESEKDTMDEENYEDTMDVLGMLRGNLQKVSAHGQSTTRTLKAMEEMLKDRTGGIVPMDLTTVLRQDCDMLRTYYAADIEKCGIDINVDIPQGEIRIKANADQLSKTMMSLLGNAVYAVVKKAQRQKYVPAIALRATSDDEWATVTVRDNGIGIEPTIINKVFDPFFTTKTTGEAAGVGLYLSREIIQNYGGDIKVESVKDEYTEFTITLPTIKA
jgi:signal transduction histidine kinase